MTIFGYEKKDKNMDSFKLLIIRVVIKSQVIKSHSIMCLFTHNTLSLTNLICNWINNTFKKVHFVFIFGPGSLRD